MKITFIAHSAFLVEWDKFYTLFDYVYEPDYTGTLPPLDPQKPLLVFSSHSHEDHFDGKVFGLLEQYPLTQFFVSRDTRLTERRRKWLGISDEAFARTTVLRPDSILLTEAAGEELSVRHQVHRHRQRLSAPRRGQNGLPRRRPELVALGERGQGLLQ